MKNKYRSKLEKNLATNLKLKQIKFEYENLKVPYVLECSYNPDFQLPNGIIVETKGFFKPEDRRKMKAVISQNPHLDIRMCFENPNVKLNKGSDTTYGEWCTKNKIKWGVISDVVEWAKEEPFKE